MKVKFRLFKESGKWAYDGISEIPDSTNLWDADVLTVLDRNQNDVTHGCIANRGWYYCMVELVDQPESSDKFFYHLFLQQQKEK